MLFILNACNLLYFNYRHAEIIAKTFKEVSDIISRSALIGQKSNTIFLNLSLLFFIVFNTDLSSSLDMLNISSNSSSV